MDAGHTRWKHQIPAALNYSGDISLVLDSRDAFYNSNSGAEFHVKIGEPLPLQPEGRYQVYLTRLIAHIHQHAADNDPVDTSLFYVKSKALCKQQIVGPRQLEIAGIAHYDPDRKDVFAITGPPFGSLNVRNLAFCQILDICLTDRFGDNLSEEIVDLSHPIIAVLHISKR